jgi:protease-4
MENESATAASPNQPPSSAGYPAPQIILQPPPTMFGRFGKLLFMALGIAVMVILAMIGSYHSYFSSSEGPQEKYHSLTAHATKKIAIIGIEGAILEGDGFVKKQIDRVRSDDSVVAVVLRIDSPGGTVTGSNYLYHHLRKLADERKLPIVVSMGSICASGGYYIAMAVDDQPDAIFAEPTTWTGSIGVVIPHYDFSGLLGSWNVTDDSVVSGPLKLMGSPTRAMRADERKVLQALVDESFQEFKQIVANGRPKFRDDPQALDAAATGQIFTAKQALERGLVDKLGFVEDAIDRAVELSGLSRDELRCVKYKQPRTLVSELMGAQTRSAHSTVLDPATWLDLTAPRAYYLWTWLPTILSNSRPH